MPRRVVRASEHDRERSLGWLAWWWIETLVVHGPGAVQGEPTVLTDEYGGFIVDCYAQDANGKRLYDSAFFSRPKGCDKSGLAAKIALFEAFGPCRFAGYAKGGETYEVFGQVYTYSKGEPMGKPINVPYIRILATEEGQTGNVYDTIYYNLTDDSAPLSQMRAYGCEPGLTRTILPGGGEITPSTAGAASKDGGKETFSIADETHLYVTPMNKQMYATVARNMVKRRREGTWMLETTTMYAPGQESVAEVTYKKADAIEEKKSRRERLLFDHRWGSVKGPDGKPTDFTDETAARAALTDAYGDALAWVDLDGLVDALLDPHNDVNDSVRYFLNALYESMNQWIDNGLLEHALERARSLPALTPGDEITLGFDGSRSDDSTVLIACRVSDGLLVPLHVQEIPDGPEAKGWQVDRDAVDAAVYRAFERYTVVAFFADPPFYQDYLDKWQTEFGEQLRVKAAGRHAIEWWTNRDIQMVNAVSRLHDAFVDGEVAIGDLPGGVSKHVLVKHMRNARRWVRRVGTVIGKEAKGSPRKMDAAMGACLAYQARADYINRGEKPAPRRPRYPIRVR